MSPPEYYTSACSFDRATGAVYSLIREARDLGQRHMCAASDRMAAGLYTDDHEFITARESAARSPGDLRRGNHMYVPYGLVHPFRW